MRKILILISIIIFGIAVFKTFYRPSSCGAVCGTQIGKISSEEFLQKTKLSEITILDVRTPEEFSSGHISGAINLNFNDQHTFMESLKTLDKNRLYLVYCCSGNRSNKAVDSMSQQGFTQILDLEGGILSWTKANLPLTKN